MPIACSLRPSASRNMAILTYSSASRGPDWAAARRSGQARSNCFRSAYARPRFRCVSVPSWEAFNSTAEDSDESRQIVAWAIVVDRAAGLRQSDIASQMALLADRIAGAVTQARRVHNVAAAWVGCVFAAIGVAAITGDRGESVQMLDAV